MIEALDTSALPAMPAPFWFVQFFKVLGFVLHMVPMNLWFVGMALAVLFYRRSGHARAWAERLGTQMPVIVAFGVNFGIVPLLFIQTAYPWAFYPATILTAWFWFSIVILLIFAYYGVYAFAFGLKAETGTMPAWRYAAGWIAAGLFLLMGLLFCNGLSLLASPDHWKPLWLSHSAAGAATGTAHHFADLSLWLRWLLMLGLAMLTTAAYTVVDAACFVKADRKEYRLWAARFAWQLGLAGAVVTAAAGAAYVWGTWDRELLAYMTGGVRLPLTVLTAASPVLPVLALTLFRHRVPDIFAATAAGGSQVAVLAFNAVSRQVVQNLELASYGKVWEVPQSPDWGAMALFLVTFVLGVAVIGWMVAQVARAAKASAP
ncbi:MAG: hypothetical protein GYA33_13635 [Thermogutta sp.]|nr:hypothetical protein [Thermogutta sp.]